MKKDGVIILSGGMDSTTLLYHLKDKGVTLHAISFNYGQKHSKELKCAAKICKLNKISHKIVNLSNLKGLLDSTLTTKEKDIPEGLYDQENMKATVVPNRNMIMLSIATGYTISLGLNNVYYGAHKGDHEIYPDCRVTFYKAMTTATQRCHFYPVYIRAPFMNKTKTQVAHIGIKLKVPYELTWTCYKGGSKPCGKCGTCTERVESFLENHKRDPLMSSAEFSKAVKYLRNLKPELKEITYFDK